MMLRRLPLGRLSKNVGVRQEALFYVGAVALLLWPLAINRAPFYSADSASYLRGGAFGINTALHMLHYWWQTLVGAAPGAGIGGGDQRAIVAGAIAQSGGVRSVIYSVLTYGLRAPGHSLLALAIAQAGAVALVISILRRLMAPRSHLGLSLAVVAGIAFLTSAAWYAAFVVPDVLAGVVIVGSLALTLYVDRMKPIARLLVVLLIALCITTHSSHLIVAFCVLCAGTAAHFWLSDFSLGGALRKIAWFASPLVLAVTALLTTSYLAFGKASLAPKRYPILMARSVADGPGAWYLRDHCATEHFAICEIFGRNPPRQVNAFLWAEGGVRYRASPAQMDRIRAEESLIIRRAIREYPLEQARLSIGNVLRQLVNFGVTGLRFGEEISDESHSTVVQARPDRPLLRAIANASIYLSFCASILMLLVLRRRLTAIEVAALWVAVVGLLSNAAVCGVLSGVTDRYQGRVAWVLPLLAGVILLRLWSEESDPAGRLQPLQR